VATDDLEEAAMRVASASRSLLAALAALVLAVPALAASPAVQAVWAPRHVYFVYRGFTVQYSCSGLRDQIVRLLTRLGARDLNVRPVGCVRPEGPERFPGVEVSMRVLVPAARTADGAARVVAHWKKVVLLSGGGYHAGGKCELMAQFRHTFLPVFAARAIHLRARCIPRQLTPGVHLSAEVLVPDSTVSPAH
jgi:hypothetical protein